MKKSFVGPVAIAIILIFAAFKLVNAQTSNVVDQLEVNKKVESSLVSYIKNVTSEKVLSSTHTSTKVPTIILLKPTENPQVFISKLLSSKKLNGKFMTFSIINGFATELSSNEILDISLMPEVEKVYLDKEINITTSIFDELIVARSRFNSTQYTSESEEETLNESAHQIGADFLWERGFKGQGIKVAILDTGIDRNHPALKNKVIYEKDLTWWDEKLDPNDYNGHGTHVAGIVAGYYENGTLDVTGTSITYFYVSREIISGPNSSQIAVYKIKADGPYPPLGMIADPLYPPGSNHVKFYDKDSTPIELFTWGNISCDPSTENCNEKWKEKEFTLVKVGKNALEVNNSYQNTTTNTTVSYVDKNNVTVISSVMYKQPLNVVSGIAPNASLMNFKVLDDEGRGYESSIIKGIELAIENGANIISMSLGDFGHPDDVLSQVVDKAVEKGVVVVVAAGNNGFLLFSITSPGTARSALTIGCVDKENNPCWFTSWGPLISGEIKPDIVAPGYQIVSACAEKSYLGRVYGCNYTEGKLFIPSSGTSTSTPHVAGLAALLLSVNKSLTPKEIKNLLVQNVRNQTAINCFTQLLPIIVGSGVVNGTEAYLSLQNYGLVFDPSNLFFGYLYDDKDNSITLHVKNLLTTPRTYSLKYYAGWPTIEEGIFTDLVYSPNNSVTFSSDKEADIILYINSTKVRELLGNATYFINFMPFYVYIEVNGTKNYTFPANVILPEKLEISYIDSYETAYTKIEELNDTHHIFGKWYWINVLNNTDFLVFDNYLGYTSYDGRGFGIFGVVDPNNVVKDQEFGWLYHWESQYPSVEIGKWKIVAFAVGNNSYAYISATKPTLFINYTSTEGTPGDSFIFEKKIKNLIDVPLSLNITKRIDSYVSGSLLEKKSDTILYPDGMGYFEFNISNYTEGVTFNFDFSNNTLQGCYDFDIYFFNPEGELNYTSWLGFCKYYPFFYESFTSTKKLQQSPSLLPKEGLSPKIYPYPGYLLNPDEGLWKIIVVPLKGWYWWYENKNEKINLTIKMKDLVKEESWSKPLNNLTIYPGEDANFEFNITIPENAEPWTYHTDIYEINIAPSSEFYVSSRDIYINTWVSPFHFMINVSNTTKFVNDEGVEYFTINYTGPLPLIAKLFGYNNTPKESFANFTLIKVLKFFDATLVDWEGKVYSYVYPVLDYENKFTTEYYYINGSTLINLTLPKWISQGYWMLYGTENKTNGYSNQIFLFVNSPVIDIQTSPNTTLPLNFSSEKAYLEPLFNSSMLGRISVEKPKNLTVPEGLISLNSIRVELDENLKKAMQWSIIRLYYDPSAISKNHINEDSLSIYWFNENEQKWEKIASSINKVQHYVEAKVTHFSIYALLGEILPTSTSSPGSIASASRGGGGGGGGAGGVGGSASLSSTCEENWNCSEWSECFPNNTQVRTCVDLNKCGTTTKKPEEVRSCIYKAPSKTPVCGNGICEVNLGENQTNCCLDCGCPEGYECKDNVCSKIMPRVIPSTGAPSPISGFIVFVTSRVGMVVMCLVAITLGFILIKYRKKLLVF